MARMIPNPTVTLNPRGIRCIATRCLATLALLALPSLSVCTALAPSPARAGEAEAARETRPPPLRIHARLIDPRENPHDDRRHVRPPGWDVFGNRTRFTSLRGFSVEGDQIVGLVEEIEKYVVTHQLGEIVWPSYPVVFAKNLDRLADEILKRDLFLFDIWGFVPGSGPGGYWQQFRPPPEALALLERKLGPRWLGMDIGEQDGRYVGGYASQMIPASGGRLEQYLNFHRHFRRMGDDIGNRLSVLVSLNFGHYLVKDGTYATIGAETGQALPNSQVYYAFIRGAGKQYGVPWFGNVSIFNRWGYKTYGSEGPDHGPTLGTSLSLMKRLLYTHILYDSVFVGFENGWFDGEKLSPIGRIQQAARKWVAECGQPGVQVVPVALLVDFLSGWSFPRHLYTGDVFRVWGNLPYGPGDHLTDGVLDLIYPGYADSSYFHDESGFNAPTPYGDAADCLFSDAPGWLLDRYALVVAAGELSGDAELKGKIEAYVRGGGRFVITAGSLARFPEGLCDVRVVGPGRRAGRSVRVGDAEVVEDHLFDLCPLELPDGARVFAAAGGKIADRDGDPGKAESMPAAAEVPSGAGALIVLASPFAIPAAQTMRGDVSSEVDVPLARPYPLLRHARAILDRELRRTTLFEAGEGLSIVACRRGPREYTVGIANNALVERPFSIRSLRGPIASVEELPLDRSEVGAVGHLPKGFEAAQIGAGGPDRIAGGDIRIFRVRLDAEDVVETPKVAPPPRPRGRALALRGTRTIEEQILSRPTFFDLFDGAVVDWRYLRERERNALRREGDWIRRQGLRVVADLSSGINLYPGLRVVDNLREDYEASLAAVEDVIAKLALLGGRDLIVSLHRHPENNFTDAETRASFEATLKRIAAAALPGGITVHLRLGAAKPPWSVEEAAGIVDRVGAPNLKLAPSTAVIAGRWSRARGAAPGGAREGVSGSDLKERGSDLARKLGGRVGLWLAGAHGTPDAGGHAWDFHAPIAGSGREDAIAEILGAAPEAPVAVDAILEYRDAEYREAKALEALSGARRAWR